MANDHVRGGAPQVNPNEPISTEQEDKTPPRRSLPRHTRATVNTLAADLEMDADTIRRWVVQNNCPFKQPGNEMWVDTEDLWNSWPYQRPQELPPPKRGGKRSNKERPADGPAQ